MVTRKKHKSSFYLKQYGLFVAIILSFFACEAQYSRDTLRVRRTIMTTSLASFASGSIVGLNQLWYKNYPRSSFHFFNDNQEWLQMDKAGHAFTSYTIGRYACDLFRWSGYSENQSVWIGGTTGLIYLTGIEMLDAYSSEWGFSSGDMLANFAGSFSFIAQEKFWKEQRITFKFSYSPTRFADVNPEVLGRNFQQRILKDYNGQTYWASINIHSFLASDAAFPRCINLALGYGATKMTSGEINDFDVNNFQRQREFYFSFDADLDRVRWKKKWMKKIAHVISFIKIPGPTMEIRSDGRIKFYGIFF